MSLMTSSLTFSDALEQWEALSPSQRAKLKQQMLPRTTKYIRHVPQPKQLLFLALPHREAMFTGGARAGKSGGLLMAALQYVDQPGYRALILRRYLNDFTKSDGLIRRSHEWLEKSDARWREATRGDEAGKTWMFPSGATVTFGSIDGPNDHIKFDGTAWQFIGIDELTDFQEEQYLYMFSRLVRQAGSGIPLRMRSTAVPGGRGREWVKRRFIDGGYGSGIAVVRGNYLDNNAIDQTDYQKSLAQMSSVERVRKEDGNWEIMSDGNLFKRDWFTVIPEPPADLKIKWLRYWDLASSAVKTGTDPDWTRGVKGGLGEDGIFYLDCGDIASCRETPHMTQGLVKRTALRDGKSVRIYMGRDPGQAGVQQIDTYARQVLQGYSFYGAPQRVSKIDRAEPLSTYAEKGLVTLIAGQGLKDVFDEFCAFPTKGVHDDIVDAASGAFAQLVHPTGTRPLSLKHKLNR